MVHRSRIKYTTEKMILIWNYWKEGQSLRGIASDGIVVSKANRTLDIRVQPGGMTDAMILKPFVNAVGINLIIKEYGK